MYCANCGAELAKNAGFCSGCGEKMPLKTSYVGFSPKINDPSFAKYTVASKKWALLFSIIIGVIAVIAFPIYGEYSGDIDWPYSLYYGIGIGGMFVAIALVTNFQKNLDSTWDGVVTDKEIYEREYWDKNTDRYDSHTVYEYTVKRDDTGKLYSHSTEDDATVYNYYNIGDKVRHHKGFGYEKYDKSKDTFMFCIACGSINDLTEEYCFRCKCPLLK